MFQLCVNQKMITKCGNAPGITFWGELRDEKQEKKTEKFKADKYDLCKPHPETLYCFF